MAARLLALAVIVIVALSAFGLLVTEADVVDETAASAVYLLGAGIVLAIVITLGLILTIKRRGRP